ncbi:CoA-disulfide reductase [Selenomonas sp. TAMA-11512]|uniref:FAD-dependent oxidoreductase n=1 Tax=Selenomonas sp. TAMA-11512 TaxID=3095337 RepID=UPI00308BE51B|nr:CoA-disulfide reductase [Selenomonas sp. TAMA-11512]
MSMHSKSTNEKTYIIVGGVAGGATAAARLRRLDGNAHIILVERGEHISFANCGLPYYVGDVIKERERLLLMTPERFRARFAVDVRTKSEAVSIDAENQLLHIEAADGRRYAEHYDALLLSPGAKPLRPPIPGIDSRRILALRNVPDADALREMADRYAGSGRAVVVGGGFIGVETAENLRERGISVTLAEAAPHILAPFDSDMAKIAEKEMNDGGVGLVLGDGVKEFREEGEEIHVALASGRILTADFVVLAIGVAPDTAFLSESNIALGPRGHILVDAHFRTNVPSVYAIGDAAMTRDLQTGNPGSLPLAGPANRQGRLAADNIAGRPHAYGGFVGTSILKVFSLTAASVGRNERALQGAGLVRGRDYEAVVLHPLDHVGYYPGSTTLTMKLLYGTDGHVLGAQIVGAKGVKARIDTIAAAIACNATTGQLAALELAYAPPFGAAKDPVNMAGYMAENAREGRVRFLPADDLAAAREKGLQVLDVRAPIERRAAPFPADAQIPLEELSARAGELDSSREWAILCKVGQSAYFAACMLAPRGFRVQVIAGGYTSIRQAAFSPSFEAAPPDGDGNAAKTSASAPTADAPAEELDLTGMSCPGPLMELQKRMQSLPAGTCLRAVASDPGFYADSAAWAQAAGHHIIERRRTDGLVSVLLQKAGGTATFPPTDKMQRTMSAAEKHKTIVVFSGDLDKVLAAFVIANGALAMGGKVTMFFTFWGLNALRRPEGGAGKKPLLDRLFGWMMPRGSRALKLSNMNMGGIGTHLMRRIMREKGVVSLESLMQSAIEGGVKLIACQMSMDVMGIRHEELIAGVEAGGVATYLAAAEQADTNLFI